MIQQPAPYAPFSTPIWTPEGVLIFIGIGFIAILIGLIAYLGKKQVDTILVKIDGFDCKQSDCRETLPTRFADKIATAADLKELYARTDRHEKTLERHSTILGGRRAEDRLRSASRDIFQNEEGL